MKSQKVVITGGPSTGKTVIIQQLESFGYYCFHEIVRTMTLEAKKKGNPESFVSNPLAFVKDPYEFNQRILKGRVDQHSRSVSIKNPYVFFDRGIPDILAYMDYFNQSYTSDFEEACATRRYDKVLILPPWEEIYVADNERLESFEQSIEIHEHLKNTYMRYDYDPVLIPTGTVKDRISCVLNELKEDF